MTEERFHCACGRNLKCEDECRTANLFRENRKFLGRCPSAYGVDDELHEQKRKPKKEVHFKSQVPELEELKSCLSVIPRR